MVYMLPGLVDKQMSYFVIYTFIPLSLFLLLFFLKLIKIYKSKRHNDVNVIIIFTSFAIITHIGILLLPIIKAIQISINSYLSASGLEPYGPVIFGAIILLPILIYGKPLDVQKEMKDIKNAMYPVELEKTEHYDANGNYTGSSIKIKKN
jgi:hypothetical protein